MMSKKLYKSNSNRMINGVCGGIAEYFNIDPTLVRLGWLLFCFLGGSGFLAYIAAAIIIPSGTEYQEVMVSAKLTRASRQVRRWRT